MKYMKNYGKGNHLSESAFEDFSRGQLPFPKCLLSLAWNSSLPKTEQIIFAHEFVDNVKFTRRFDKSVMLR